LDQKIRFAAPASPFRVSITNLDDRTVQLARHGPRDHTLGLGPWKGRVAAKRRPGFDQSRPTAATIDPKNDQFTVVSCIRNMVLLGRRKNAPKYVASTSQRPFSLARFCDMRRGYCFPAWVMARRDFAHAISYHASGGKLLDLVAPPLEPVQPWP
jgi:hypothetical protein